MKGFITLKLDSEQANELLEIYAYQITGYEPAGILKQLLKEHMKDMYERLDRMCFLMEKTAKLVLNRSESMAFYLIWNDIDTSAWPHVDVLIREMVKVIDKKAKQKI